FRRFDPVARTCRRRTGARVPDEDPVIAQLNELFGEHTFFLDQHGLNIVEPVEAAEPAAECAKVVKLASWSDDSRSDLKLHEPAATEHCRDAGIEALRPSGADP